MRAEDPPTHPMAGTAELLKALEAQTAKLAELEQLLGAARMATWTWDPASDKLTASESLSEVFGLLPGQRLETSADAFPLVHPEDRERHRALVEAATRDGGSWHTEFRLIRPRDGKVIWVEDRSHGMRDPETGRMTVTGLVWDITERKHAEEALRASEQSRLLALEAAAIGDWKFEIATGRLELSPRARQMHGDGTPEVLTVEEHDRLIHPEDRAAVQAARAAALDPAGGHYRAEFRFLFEDGEVRWFESVGQGLFEERDGRLRPVRILGVMIDITERKRVEQRLREADQRKDEFLATLAHELRNPLAPIRNGLQILTLSASGDERLRRAGEMMERQMTHLVRLVDDLLEINRISRGKVELRKRRVRVSEVLSGAIESIRVQIEAKRLGLRCEADDLEVEADPDRLAQVFSNLLSNAARYTEEEGQIEVLARPEGGQAVIRVQDTGCGIPPESLESVFEMFSQGHSSEQTSGGLGIGLALARQLVQLHGGTVVAHSEGHGRGSTFTVRLPLAPALAEEPPAVEPSGPVSGAGRARRILVVDDNADAANSLSMLLELHGHEVCTVYGGPAALQVFESFGPEVVLLDIGMPDMDGYEVARRIRDLPRGREVRLLALTGWGQDEDKRRALKSGFDEHLTKPADPALLESLLGPSSMAARV